MELIALIWASSCLHSYTQCCVIAGLADGTLAIFSQRSGKDLDLLGSYVFILHRSHVVVFACVDVKVDVCSVVIRRMEPAVVPLNASWIEPCSAHSLLPCEGQPAVGGLLEQSPCGWRGQPKGWGKKKKRKHGVSCSDLPCSQQPLSRLRPHSKHSQCRSAARSRFVSCVLVEVASGRRADSTRCSGCSTGPQGGLYKKLISVFWSPKL